MLALLGAMLVYPILLTVGGAFAADPARGINLFDPELWSAEGFKSRFTFAHLNQVFADPLLRQGLLNSFKIAAGTTTIATLIALPLAVLSATCSFPGKSFFNAVVLVPMILPPFVGSIGMRAILGREGALNALLGTDWDVLGGSLTIAGLTISTKLLGVIAVQSLALYPIIFLNTTAALANLDPALGEAAENLGSSPARRFFRITLPLIRPGIFAGATIVFIWSFTELGTPLMFDYYTVTPVQIFYGLKEVENSARPYALTVVMLTAAITLYVTGKLLFGGRAHAMYSKAARASDQTPLGGWRGWLAAGLFAAVGFCAVMPHLGVVLTSLTRPGQWYGSIFPTSFTTSHYRHALTSPDSFGSIVNSLKLASMAMVLDIVLGVLIGYLIVRTKVKGRAVLDALCMLPLAVPGLVMAFGFVAMSLRWPFGLDGPLSSFASVVSADPNPVPFLIIAYSIRRLPYIVRSTVAGLEQTSGELEEAAVNLGASRVYALVKVIIPLILANLIAGGLLVFSFSMLEVSDSLILAQQAADFPITKAIWMFNDRIGDGPYIASAMGVWGMALLTVTLVAASGLLGKKMGSIFRV